jgi:hypothetical protein
MLSFVYRDMTRGHYGPANQSILGTSFDSRKIKRRWRILFASISIISYLSTPFVVLAADAPPGTANPNVLTSKSESAKVDGANGAFTEFIPLDILPGRNGLQPDLSLDYNRQNADNDSIVGYPKGSSFRRSMH